MESKDLVKKSYLEKASKEKVVFAEKPRFSFSKTGVREKVLVVRRQIWFGKNWI